MINMAAVFLLSWIFIGMTLINRILGGQFVTTTDVSYVNNIAIFRSFNLLNVMQVPIPNFNFFTTGLPQLMKWDYSFFGGNAGLVSYLLYALTAAVAFGCICTVIGMMFYYFNKLP